MSARADVTALPGPKLLFFATVSFAALLPAAIARADLAARVVAVHDGDTLTVVAERRRVRVRLAEIDAPELGQPFGKRAKKALADLCFGKLAAIEIRGRDRYDRAVARVKCDGRDANAEQVRLGYAWVYTRYAAWNSPLYALEVDAKASGRGIWSLSDPVPPWRWRQRGLARRLDATDPRKRQVQKMD